ncbi:hypothetical protein [Nocardioides sp. SR21]|uniref:hypothetical protein n=1 Tax=Nocardioides sp. SR21 TaxID=2919501 RepID=UPI001FAB3597|nr:hypothetical protein [Nocardioides sp. SR21]
MRRPIVPFLTPPEAAVSHGGWLLRSGEEDIPLPTEVPHWDYQTTLQLAAPVSVDRRTVTEVCHLDRESGLAVLVMVKSSHTNAEILAARLELPMADTYDLAVELQLDGPELGGRLTLTTLLVVTEPKPLDRLAPQHPGSIIWRTSHWTDLEGVGTQFPTDTVDFAAAGMDPDAGWQFRIDLADPDARFMAAARLTLNSGHPAIVRLLAGAKDAGTEQLLRTLNWDITRQMVFAGLDSDDVVGLEIDHDATSVAAVLRNLLGRIWPTVSTATLREWRRSDPSRIEIHLQHNVKLVK